MSIVATYERLKAEVQRLRKQGRIRTSPNAEERADWAFGTTKIENDAVTLEMAEDAVRELERAEPPQRPARSHTR